MTGKLTKSSILWIQLNCILNYDIYRCFAPLKKSYIIIIFFIYLLAADMPATPVILQSFNVREASQFSLMYLMVAAYYDIMIFSKICSNGGDLPKQLWDRHFASGRDARSAGRSQAIHGGLQFGK